MIPDSLQQAFKNKTLVPVIGAGVSMAITGSDGKSLFPSWSQLLELGAQRLEDENKQKLASAARAMLAVGHYKIAADLLREGLTGNLWNKFFRDIFSIDPDAISGNSLALSRAIWQLGNKIINLNYDKVLRYACPSQAVAEIDNKSLSELSDFERPDDGSGHVIWHLHGKLDNINDLILATESYDRLYVENDEHYKAALAVLSSVIRKQNLIFIGCSLDDAELLEKFEEQHKIFGGAIGPHYALVRLQDVPAISSKLKKLPIDIISFKQFGQPLLDLVSAISSRQKALSIQNTLQSKITQPTALPNNSSKKNLAVLSASPINRNYHYDELLKEIGRIKCDVTYLPLNVASLNELNNFDYIFILSKLVKGGIAVENEDLSAGKVGFKDLENSLGIESFSGLFIFLDHKEGADLNQLDLDLLALPTVIVPEQKKEQVGTLNFKIFKRKDINLIENCTVKNIEKLNLVELTGQSRAIRPKTLLPENIDPHASRSYIGRVSDLENICRKISHAREKNEVVTVKGAGGIGKTLTVKKVAIEFAKRRFFVEGIDFIDCEAITSFEIFQYKVAQVFNLEEVPDLRKELSENHSKYDCLIILDNLETLLYVDDKDRILSLIDFICEYVTIVATSREMLSINCEEPYELRRFTSDEAYDLFMLGMPGRTPSNEEKRFIRDEILDILLDNNPLAIKLITQNTPRNKDWKILKQELESDFFTKVSDAEIRVFDSNSDLNIERKRSLYASINYSYQHLTAEEKIAFELLSLFPDGINLENFKLVSKVSKEAENNGTATIRRDFVITDPVIKGLERKSMVQVDNHMIKLQSIVRKFSEQKLLDRPEEEIERYFNRAYNYNRQFARALAKLKESNQYNAIKIFSSQQNNFLKCVSFTNIESVETIDFLKYLSNLSTLFADCCASKTFGDTLQSLNLSYLDDPLSTLGFELIKISTRYYEGHFDEAFKKLQDTLPLAEITKMELDSELIQLIVGHAASIYAMEGFSLETAEFDARGSYILRRYSYSLFCMGEIDETLMKLMPKNFFTLEMMNILETLNVEYVDDYIDSIYENNHIELMQSHYSKSKITEVPAVTVKSLVAVNPYTAGLKDIMLAFVEKDKVKKIEGFERALKNLVHIRYYYVEALYFYAKFLATQEDDKVFNETYEEAISLARQHHYRYLQFLLENIKENTGEKYNSKDYPIPSEVNFDNYIAYLIEHARRSQGVRQR
jgi:hypothetical protein